MKPDPLSPVKLLINLYAKWSHTNVKSIDSLPESGSYRKYYRICGENGKTVIGVFNSDKRENLAFVYINRHLLKTGNCVPEIYATDPGSGIYLEEDLGDTTLMDFIHTNADKTDRNELLVNQYQRVIDAMPGLQVEAYKELDFSKCYPRAEFDVQSIMWDLNYFKYNLLKPLKIHFYEQDLEDDFRRIAAYLSDVQRDFFMFRDFQSRNIMLHEDKIYFIDFQGGRKGPLQYDLASLVFEAKANLDPETRESLLAYYLELFARKYSWFKPEEFMRYFYGFVYLRLMQAMGAYGFRGLIERKSLFIRSLPFAIRILDWLMKFKPFPFDLNAMSGLFEKLVHCKEISIQRIENELLTVTINSFAYKSGIPVDVTGHGGGFVFDCRALSNPGRNNELRNYTGLDKPVMDYLALNVSVQEFFSHTCNLVGQAVENYLMRGFRYLSVNYGCTGGRHRSVYLSERLGEYLKNNYRLNVVIYHTELEKHVDEY